MPHFRKVMTKVGLADAAKRYMKATQTQWPSFLPISIILSPFWQNLDEDGNHPLKSSQFQRFLDVHRQCNRGEGQHMKNHCQKNMWLIKPAAANRGIGIEIFSKAFRLLNFVADIIEQLLSFESLVKYCITSFFISLTNGSLFVS